MTTTIDYDGRRFRPVPVAENGPSARYHQRGRAVWGEFAGGEIEHAVLAGSATPDGVIDFGYTMLMTDGRIVVGRCHSEPELLDDGRLRLVEHWERYGPDAATGTSYLEEIPTE